MTIISFPPQKPGCCSGCSSPEWITLPVAPIASARSRFFGEGKLPQTIPVQGALSWIDDLQAKGTPIAGVDINGPGDPLASLPLSLEVLNLLRVQYPDLTLGMTTLGLGLAENVEQLKENGINKIILLMDAVTPEVVAKLFAWIRPGKRNTPMSKASTTLVDQQARAISACRSAGISVIVQTAVYHNINEQEVEEIARLASKLGAESMALIPGTGWTEGEGKEPLLPPSTEIMAALRESAARHITIIEPIGGMKAGENTSEGERILVLPKPTEARPNVAVLSSNGMDIDLHLGHAIKALVYGPREDGLPCLLEARYLPEPGGGESRWLKVSEILFDCFALLAESAGQKPYDILASKGLPIILVDENVEGTVDALYGGGKKGKGKGR